jgi:hypothetical protein
MRFLSPSITQQADASRLGQTRPRLLRIPEIVVPVGAPHRVLIPSPQQA